MSNFIRDNTSLPEGKSDAPGQSLLVAANQKVTSSEWQTVMNAAKDIRSWITGGDFFGLASNLTAALSGVGQVLFRSRRGAFEVSENGRAYRGVRTVFNVLSYGADPTNTVDSSAAFAAAIADMGSGQHGETLYVPAGDYKMLSSLAVNKNIVMLGEGSNNEGGFTSTLHFAQSTAGLVITGQAQIDNIAIQGPNSYNAWTGTANTHGIEIRAGGIILRNVFVKGFNGHGVYVNGTSYISDLFAFSSVHVQEVGRSGYYLEGGDSNAGTGSACSAIDCGEWGIYDHSFLGNTWIGCHVSSNNGGAYKCDQSTANSAFIGCYSESGQPASVFNQGVIVVGGTHGAGITPTSTHYRVLPSSVAPGGTAVVSSPDGAGGALYEGMSLGSVDPNTGAAITLRTWLGSSLRLYFANKLPTGWSALVGGSEWFNWHANALGSNRTMLSTYGAAVPGTSTHKNRFVGPAVSLFNDFFMGTGGDGTVGNGAIKISALDAAPSAGQWHVGDRVYNAQPVSGGTEGWVCTVGGTYGTYSEGKTVTSTGGTSLTVSGGGTLVIEVGDRLLINGTTDVYVTGVSNLKNAGASPVTTLTVSGAVPAGSSLSIAFVAPTFKTFGSIA